ncbi:hypothetical protein [Oceanirhabdus sp. W0125-5]|nr:hypothetical protein [Oceanirhabdus sp. W0125-5]WBW96726.1 hypothetical protein OW730_23995 [Oceanirhabdus sp. W0125-5]
MLSYQKHNLSIYLIKKFIAEVDSDAFVDVLPVVSVWGKGLGFDSLIDE